MTIVDHYYGLIPGLTSPLENVLDIVPDDDADLEVVTRAIMVGTAGDVAVIMNGAKKGDPPTVLRGLEPGVDYPRRVRRVLATGTSAVGIQGGY